jgi:hypothetical protein
LMTGASAVISPHSEQVQWKGDVVRLSHFHHNFSWGRH